MGKREVPIGEILKSVFSRLESEKKLSKEEIEGCWKGLVGARAFTHSRPTALRKKVLTIGVDSSAWMQEFVLKKRQLLKGLKKAFGKDKIAEIHFRIGEWDAESREQKTKEK